MRMHEVLPSYLGDAVEIVDLSEPEIDLDHHLRVSERMRYGKYGLDEAAKLHLGPATVVLSLLGPNPPAQTDPEALAPVLRRLKPGARAILLIGWPIQELPYHRLLSPLVDGGCQVVDAVPLDRASAVGAHCALIVDRVERLAPLRPYLIDTPPDPTRDVEPDATENDELRTVLRAVNEYLLGSLVARPLRRRLIELENAEAERAAARKRVDELEAAEAQRGQALRRVDELSQLVAARDTRLEELEAALARSESRLAMLQSSASYRIGRAVARGIHLPGRVVIGVSSDLARVWRPRPARKRRD
jgi:hypothetical protein